MRRWTLTLVLAAATCPQAASGQFSVIDPADLMTTSVEEFQSIPDGPLNGILSLPGFEVSEHFAGQTVTSGFSDVISGTPSGPLMSVAGPTDANLYFGETGSVPDPMSVLGLTESGNGRGAMAFLFDEDQYQFGFYYNQREAGSSGTIHMNVFDRSGALLGSFSAIEPPSGMMAFQSTGFDIAGFTLTHSGAGTGGYSLNSMHFNAVPEPSTIWLVVTALGALAVMRRRAVKDSHM